MKRAAPESGPRPLPLTQAEVPSQTQQRHVEGSSNQGSLIEVVMPLAPVVPQGALPGAQAVQPLPMPVIDVPLMPAAVPMADAPPLVLTSAQLLALPFGGVLQPPVLQAPPAIHFAEEHGPVEPGASEPLQNHPHIQLETGKYYRFKDDKRIYELHWSRHPQLWCNGERDVDLEDVPGAVQLLGAMIAVRRRMPRQLLARDAYAQLVLQGNGTSYSTLPEAFNALRDTFSESAFSMNDSEDIAFVRPVRGPFEKRIDAPFDSTGTLALDRRGNAYWLPASATLYTRARLPFNAAVPELGASPPCEPHTGPAPFQVGTAPRPRTLDLASTAQAPNLDAVRFLLWHAIRLQDEAAVLRHLLTPGACSDQVLALARSMAVDHPAGASPRIAAAVEQAASLHNPTS